VVFGNDELPGALSLSFECCDALDEKCPPVRMSQADDLTEIGLLKLILSGDPSYKDNLTNGRRILV